MTQVPRCLRHTGRLRRLPFWMWAAVIHSLTIILSLRADFLFPDPADPVPMPGPLEAALVQGGLVVLLVLNFCVHVQRLHDAGRSGWWAAPLPFLSFLSTIVIGLLPTDGDNKYGPDASPNSRFWSSPI